MTMTLKTNLKSYYLHKDKEKYEYACRVIGKIVEEHENKMIRMGATKSEVAAVRRAFGTLIYGYEDVTELVGP